MWDRGEWVPLEDWREGLEKGKLLFELKGYKLHGKWTLVKIKKSEKEWLLIKERDAFVKSPGDVFPEESVLSGLTVDEVKAGQTPVAQVRAAIEDSRRAARARRPAGPSKPMLAESADDAFTRDGWLFELKLDGYRLIAGKSRRRSAAAHAKRQRLHRRLSRDRARGQGAAVRRRASSTAKSSCSTRRACRASRCLQQRGRISSPLDVKRAAVELPATFFAFDLIAFEDFDLRPLPLTRRKELLAELVPKLGAVRDLDHIEREGEAFLAQVDVARPRGNHREEGRRAISRWPLGQWLKIKAECTGDFVIVGFTRTEGQSRNGLGALQLAD